MASPKTEATELSVGIGILGFNHPKEVDKNLTLSFQDTLSPPTYKNYLDEYSRDTEEYSQFIKIGLQIREIFSTDIRQIQWTGGQRLASTILGAKDLFIPAINRPISIKNDSNVVANPSPENLFINLPSGLAQASKAEDWFIHQDKKRLQLLYECVRDWSKKPLPRTIEEFYAENDRNGRKELQEVIRDQKAKTEKERMKKLYLEMCDSISVSSARTFNENYDKLPRNLRQSVSENIFKQFFRVNSVPYILAGIDHKEPFILEVPDLTSLKGKWAISHIEAFSQEGKGQCEVLIIIDIYNKETRDVNKYEFHVELRWSHGKFCGNPESKLYKNFHWAIIPFFCRFV